MNGMLWADWNLKALGDFDAFVFRDRTWSSAMVNDHAARLASGLLAMGLVPGDRVLLWLSNCPELDNSAELQTIAKAANAWLSRTAKERGAKAAA